MKPHKFVAATSRAALAKVREALGDDAVILSNRTTAGGVEVVAIAEHAFDSLVDAVESDEFGKDVAAKPTIAEQVAVQIRQSMPASPKPLAPPRSAAIEDTAATRAGNYPWEVPVEKKAFRFVDFVKGRRPMPSDDRVEKRSEVAALPAQSAGRQAEVRQDAAAQFPKAKVAVSASLVRSSTEKPVNAVLPSISASNGLPAKIASESEVRGQAHFAPTAAPQLMPDQAILDELKALRNLVEGRNALPRPQTPTNGTKLVVELLRRELQSAGFPVDLIDAVLRGLSPDYSVAQARDWVLARIARSLACAPAGADIVETGGVFALTGPTGVGKTTTAAKLAARCTVRYGAKSVGLITTDTYRIGAPDQLRIYGKILGVPVHTVHDFDWLGRTIDALSDRRLILIDTVGMGQRDERVQEVLNFLDEARIKRLLLVAAASQTEAQGEVVHFYRGQTAAGTVITKIDEAVKLAPVLSVMLRYKQQLQYITNGQRVPEDIHLPDATNLVRTAMRAEQLQAARSQANREGRDSAATAH
jgi:flagellar biosynthesis protein FlhF